MKELIYELVKSTGVDPMTLAFFLSVGIGCVICGLMKVVGTFWVFQALNNPTKAAAGYGMKKLADAVGIGLVMVCFIIIVWILNQVGYNIRIY